MKNLKVFLTMVAIISLFSGITVYGQNIIDEWKNVKVPDAPELKPVKVDPKDTALLLLDFNSQTCNQEKRPRCVSSIPAVKKLMDDARKNKELVVYSLSPNAKVTDIAKDLAPGAKDPVVTSGPDKFLGTMLEKILKDKKIKTVIVVGTAAHGAVLNTSSQAALRGFKVIIPVDGVSAEDTYAEQYTAWHLANAPRISAQVTLTKIDNVTY